MFAYNNIRSTQYQCMLQKIVTSIGLTINTQLLKNNLKLNSSRSLPWLLHFNMCPLTVDVCVHCLSALPAVQYPLRSIYTSNMFTRRQFPQVIRVCVETSVNSNYQASGLNSFARLTIDSHTVSNYSNVLLKEFESLTRAQFFTLKIAFIEAM